MSVLYLDFTNGNDANNISSFALRGKTITSGATAARIAPGDVIRIMKSEDPVSLSINATWTNTSPTVTLASALTKNIDTCEAAWTAVSANVTQSNPTTRKEGSKSIQFNIAAAFATGQMAYLTMAATDFSAYNKVCFWIKPTIAVASGVLKILLCTDGIGTAVANTITINEALTANQWRPITIDTGGALTNNCNSISFDAISDPGTVNIQLDNIFAANNLTLTSVISLNSSATSLEWYPVASVNGTTVKIDQGSQTDASATIRGFYGTTTTATTYKIEPIPVLTAQSTNEAGTSDTVRESYSGGWDTTNMTSQTGLTFLDFRDAQNVCLTINQGFISVEKIVFIRGNLGINTAGVNINIDNCGVIDSGSTGLNMNGGRNKLTNSVAYNTNGTGISLGGVAGYSSGCTSNNNASNGLNNGGGQLNIIINSNTNNNVGAGINQTSVNSRYYNPTSKSNNNSGIIMNATGSAFIYNPVTSGNSAGISAADGAIVYVDNPNCTDGNPFNANANTGRIQISRLGDDVSVARIYEGTTTTICVQIDTSTVHGSATKSFKHSPQAVHNTSTFALIQKCQPFAVASSGTLTVSFWVQRSSTNIGAQIMIRGGQVDGVAADLTTVASAAINVWEQLTITCSPTQAGMIIVEMQTYQISGSGNAFFSDASVTQA